MEATIDDYRLTAGALLSRSRRQLLRLIESAEDDMQNRRIVYPGLTRAQTAIAAQARRDDALYILALKKS